MIEVGFKTHTGLRRTQNEDACFVMPERGIYIVADGVGGNSGGEVASRTAVSGIARFVEAYPVFEEAEPEAVYRYFSECIREVNGRIFADANRHIENSGMATTLVLCCLIGSEAYIANIGDSRAYIFRDGVLTQITRDHTYVNDLISAGIITSEEARTHSKKHVITKALGAEETVDFEFKHLEVLPSDILLLCTDGLHGEVSDSAIQTVLSENLGMSQISERLINIANDAGGTDNITVVCLKI